MIQCNIQVWGEWECIILFVKAETSWVERTKSRTHLWVFVTIINLEKYPRSGCSFNLCQLRVGFDHRETCQLFSGLLESLGTILTSWWLYVRMLNKTVSTVSNIYVHTCIHTKKILNFSCVPLSHDRYVLLYCVSGEQHHCWNVFSALFYCLSVP